MALPIVPIAVAAGALALASRISVQPAIQEVEDALDSVDEGTSFRRTADNAQINGAHRYKRVVRFGSNGPGLEVDATVLARIKFRKV
ncbi:MAG: hypothetical protein AAF826_03895 [Pseudomonadota bacterium]